MFLQHLVTFFTIVMQCRGTLRKNNLSLSLSSSVGTEKEEMDTHRFRQATWYYIHSIKGIRHDDYHYRNVCTTD